MRSIFPFGCITISVLIALTFFEPLPGHAVIYVTDEEDVSIKTWDSDASGNMPPLTDISGHVKRPAGVAVDATGIYVANGGNDSISVFPIDSTGDAEPMRVIQGPDTHLDSPRAITVDNAWIFVANLTSITVFPKNSTGNTSPARLIQGANTQLNTPYGIAADESRIYVANSWGHSITVFPKNATGNVAPTRQIRGDQTTFDFSNSPNGVAVDASWIYVANSGNNSIAVFPIGATGDVAPTRLIQGANTNLSSPLSVTVDAGSIYVSSWGLSSIGIFPIGASGNVSPTRSIGGSNTEIKYPYGLSVDANWVYVASLGNNRISIFPLDATGNVAPARSIKSAINLSEAQGVAADANWVYVADGENSSVTIFPLNGSGDIAPARLIKGANTLLQNPTGIAVDENWIYAADRNGKSVSVFALDASGNIAPNRVIKGPTTNLDGPAALSTDDGTGFSYNKESGRKQGRRVREVQGIGSSAYFDDAHFHVLKGNSWLTFGSAAESGHHPSEEMIKTLAKIAIDRLPGPSSEAGEKTPPAGPQKEKEQPGKAMGAFDIDGKTITMTHAYAFVNQKDKRKPVLILITDQPVPANQWKSESDMTRYRLGKPFRYVCFWIDKDRQEFRREYFVEKFPASAMGIFDLKLLPSDPRTFTGTVKKDKKEVSFTAVIIK